MVSIYLSLFLLLWLSFTDFLFSFFSSFLPCVFFFAFIFSFFFLFDSFRFGCCLCSCALFDVLVIVVVVAIVAHLYCFVRAAWQPYGYLYGNLYRCFRCRCTRYLSFSLPLFLPLTLSGIIVIASVASSSFTNSLLRPNSRRHRIVYFSRFVVYLLFLPCAEYAHKSHFWSNIMFSLAGWLWFYVFVTIYFRMGKHCRPTQPTYIRVVYFKMCALWLVFDG